MIRHGKVYVEGEDGHSRVRWWRGGGRYGMGEDKYGGARRGQEEGQCGVGSEGGGDPIEAGPST